VVAVRARLGQLVAEEEQEKQKKDNWEITSLSCRLALRVWGAWG